MPADTRTGTAFLGLRLTYSGTLPDGREFTRRIHADLRCDDALDRAETARFLTGLMADQVRQSGLSVEFSSLCGLTGLMDGVPIYILMTALSRVPGERLP